MSYSILLNTVSEEQQNFNKDVIHTNLPILHMPSPITTGEIIDHLDQYELSYTSSDKRGYSRKKRRINLNIWIHLGNPLVPGKL